MIPVPEEFQPILDLMNEDNPVDDSYFLNGILGIVGRENYLYIRFKKEYKLIAIPIVCFVHERQGFFTRLLKILKEYAVKEGYELIQIESVTTQAMENYVKKHGFTPRKDTKNLYWLQTVKPTNKDLNDYYKELVLNRSFKGVRSF